jgi:long-chain acyl-CoA synthetase
MNWASLPSLHRAVSERLGPRVALRHKRHGRYQDLSWRDYRRQADWAAAGLIDLGVRPGDRVAMLSENRYEWLVADHAILSTAAVTVPMHAPLSAKQVGYQIGHSDAKGVLVSNQEQASKVFEAIEELPKLEFLVSFDLITPRGPISGLTWEGLKHRGRHGEAIEDMEAREASLGRDDLATILYTSGTTGNPKGVMLTHGNILSNTEATLLAQEHEPTDILLSWLPYSHIYARTIDHYLTTLGGSTVCLAESFDAVRDNLLEIHPTWLTAVPRFYEKVWTDVENLPEDERNQELRRIFGKRLRHLSAGGAPLPIHVGHGFAAAGLHLLQGYGLTESSPVITFNRLDRNKTGTVGPPLTGVEVRIAEDGEILTRGPHVMQGYWKNPKVTAETIVDGWLHTGDVGELDEDGFLTITDRKKDLIITSGGDNVAPSILERLLCGDLYIDQAVVFGDRRQFITALIVPNFEELNSKAAELGCSIESRNGFIINPELLEFLDERIASVMREVSQPERVKKCLILDRAFQVEADELTATLKVRRRYVTNKYSAQLEALYEGTVPSKKG